jgi:hypothetical protein
VKEAIIMADATGSVTIGQKAPEGSNGPDDRAIPLIGGQMDVDEIKANFNALLYLMTEQMAVQLKLMEVMVANGVVTPEDLNEKVLSVTGNQEELSGTYNEMFTRFVGYFSALKKLQEDGKIFEAGATNVPQGQTDEA